MAEVLCSPNMIDIPSGVPNSCDSSPNSKNLNSAQFVSKNNNPGNGNYNHRTREADEERSQCDLYPPAGLTLVDEVNSNKALSPSSHNNIQRTSSGQGEVPESASSLSGHKCVSESTGAVCCRVWVNPGCLRYGCRETITVAWKLPQGGSSDKDWIGLYRAGESSRKKCLNWLQLNGLDEGEIEWTVEVPSVFPKNIGSIVVRYHNGKTNACLGSSTSLRLIRPSDGSASDSSEDETTQRGNNDAKELPTCSSLLKFSITNCTGINTYLHVLIMEEMFYFSYKEIKPYIV